MSVNANYLSPCDLQRATEILMMRAARPVSMAGTSELLRVAYWTGLRLGELAGLRLCDVTRIHSGDRSSFWLEVLVRSHQGRRTKSESSRRRLPLNAVMPAGVGKEFAEYHWRKREANRRVDPRGNYYLFAAPGAEQVKPSEEEFREPIQKALRLATNDPTVVVHSLRHSFANNMLLAIEADGASDPIWDFFAEPPRELIEVSEKIRRQLLYNEQGRRRDLFSVAELLGHSSPQITLESYIHVLPWLAYGRTETLQGRLYEGLERSIDIDAALLLKGRNAARGWRGRSNDRTTLAPLVQYWSKRLRNALAPDWAAATDREILEVASGAFQVESLIPGPAHLYRVGALRVRDALSAKAIADRVELPEAYVKKVLDFANQRARLPTRLPASDARVEGAKSRFQGTRSRYLRGHDSRESTPDLRQMPELHAGFPALPKTRVERELLNRSWQRLTRLLRDEEQRQAQTSEQPPPDEDPPLREGLRVFLRNTNSSDHTLKFAAGGHDDAVAYRDVRTPDAPLGGDPRDTAPGEASQSSAGAAGAEPRGGPEGVRCPVWCPAAAA
ncbi:MAG: tyrosine-type recombinase/integrase [Arhodomonas sp.]|nr:tyrosine-type recombinase/integrase [Arhodomonas sp.]